MSESDARETGMQNALAALRDARVVAAATESFFGLLADASSTRAIGRLLALKPRGADKGMPLLLPDRLAWRSLVHALPVLAERLAAAFWPGPLTISVRAASTVDERLLLDHRIAVRLPGSSVAAELTERFGRPLTATSANPSGAAPATEADQLRRVFGAELGSGALYLPDVGNAAGGSPSTVVVVDGDQARIARLGAIAAYDIEAVLKPVSRISPMSSGNNRGS